jgi:hypothetical protein
MAKFNFTAMLISLMVASAQAENNALTTRHLATACQEVEKMHLGLDHDRAEANLCLGFLTGGIELARRIVSNSEHEFGNYCSWATYGYREHAQSFAMYVDMYPAALNVAPCVALLAYIRDDCQSQPLESGI